MECIYLHSVLTNPGTRLNTHYLAGQHCLSGIMRWQEICRNNYFGASLSIYYRPDIFIHMEGLLYRCIHYLEAITWTCMHISIRCTARDNQSRAVPTSFEEAPWKLRRTVHGLPTSRRESFFCPLFCPLSSVLFLYISLQTPHTQWPSTKLP